MIEIPDPRPEFDPCSNYSHENYPSLKEQERFFRHVFMEGAEIDTKPRLVPGPFYGDFADIMRQTDVAIKSVNPDFTPEHIMPGSYQSPKVREEIKDEAGMAIAMKDIAEQRVALTDELAEGKLIKAMRTQKIESGMLGVPRYRKQQDEWSHEDAQRGCANACFRMVFGAIAGWVPSETAIGRQLIERYGSAVVDDEVYSNVFNTEVFSEICDKKVMTLELIGADFDLIASLTDKIRQRQPSAQVFCVVNLSSKLASRSVWHTNVLLDVTEKNVTSHDPSARYGNAFQVQEKGAFVKRWATTYNRAQLIIAV